MFTGNYTTPRQYLREKLVKRALHFFPHGFLPIVTISHNVDVNVAIAGVPKTCNWKL